MEQQDTIYPGLIIEESVTPGSGNQVNPPVDEDVISPEKVKVARLMIG